MESAIPYKGRGNDTMLAHINSREAMILKLLGGSGTINPKTGLFEFWDDGGNDPGGVGGDAGSGAAGGPDAGTSGGEAPDDYGDVSVSIDDVEQPGVTIGSFQDDNPNAPSFGNIAELAHPKNTTFQNIMDTITTNLQGLSRGFVESMPGFARGVAGRVGAKGIAALGFGINPASLAGFGIGALGAYGMNALAENASPPSAETVAANVSPGLEGAGLEEGSAVGTPGSETASQPATAIPERRVRISPLATYPRQQAALTGMMVR